MRPMFALFSPRASRNPGRIGVIRSWPNPEASATKATMITFRLTRFFVSCIRDHYTARFDPGPKTTINTPSDDGVFVLVPRGGIEPPTQGFSVLRSTSELPRLMLGCLLREFFGWHSQPKPWRRLVGARGVEPLTFAMSMRRSNQLSYAPETFKMRG